MDLLSPARISLMKVDRRKWNSIAKVCYMMLVKIELMIVENRMKNWFHRIIKIRWYNRWEYDLLWLWIERNKFLHTRYFELWELFSLNIVKLDLIVKLKSDFSLFLYFNSNLQNRNFLRFDWNEFFYDTIIWTTIRNQTRNYYLRNARNIRNEQTRRRWNLFERSWKSKQDGSK